MGVTLTPFAFSGQKCANHYGFLKARRAFTDKTDVPPKRLGWGPPTAGPLWGGYLSKEYLSRR